MKLLRRGIKGAAVNRWQEFLRGCGYAISVDGDFGPATERVSKQFQRDEGLTADGIVGSRTIGAAMARGFDVGLKDDDLDWPPKPVNLKPYTSNGARARRFGRFQYEPRPTKNNPEGIKILGSWKRDNIVRASPSYVIPGNKGVWLHKDVADSFAELWAHWGDEGLIDAHIITWNGSWVPRFSRGSSRFLSNHAWGTAFDINVAYNRLGRIPARRGAKGSVRRLVPIANKHGWYWGGHFKRRDGMHFEIAQRI